MYHNFIGISEIDSKPLFYLGSYIDFDSKDKVERAVIKVCYSTACDMISFHAFDKN